MSDKELIVFEAVKGVSYAAKSLITSYKKNRLMSKAELQHMDIKIKEYLQIERTNAVNAVSNNNIRNLISTWNIIKEIDPNSPAYTFAMRQYELESEALERILREIR